MQSKDSDEMGQIRPRHCRNSKDDKGLPLTPRTGRASYIEPFKRFRLHIMAACKAIQDYIGPFKGLCMGKYRTF